MCISYCPQRGQELHSYASVASVSIHMPPSPPCTHTCGRNVLSRIRTPIVNKQLPEKNRSKHKSQTQSSNCKLQRKTSPMQQIALLYPQKHGLPTILIQVVMYVCMYACIVCMYVASPTALRLEAGSRAGSSRQPSGGRLRFRTRRHAEATLEVPSLYGKSRQLILLKC